MKRNRDVDLTSLDLFLDTICNAFGGLVVIALATRQRLRQEVVVAAD